MGQSDNTELNEILKKFKSIRHTASRGMGSPSAEIYEDKCDTESGEKMKGLVQWTTGDDKRFVPASKTVDVLVPGCYEIMHSSSCGIYFEKVPVKTEGLVRFPQTNSERVVSEIQNFWEREDLFKEYKLTHKRGIILWGPPGSGKSSLIQLVMQDVIGRGGIVVKFGHPSIFIEGMRIFREVEKNTPAVILMEDIDSILQVHNESEVLNILDGVDQVQKCCFLATTNYPEQLGPRILNRPSRFDKRFKIDHPGPESRRLYFKHIIGTDERIAQLNIDLDKWVKDTKDFSIAHLKELFVAVTILGDDYEEAIETLSSMREHISSAQDETYRMGFGAIKNKLYQNE